jgi:hypothetical protein
MKSFARCSKEDIEDEAPKANTSTPRRPRDEALRVKKASKMKTSTEKAPETKTCAPRGYRRRRS